MGGLHLLNILPITSEDVHVFSHYKETQTATYINAFLIPQKEGELQHNTVLTQANRATEKSTVPTFARSKATAEAA